MTGSVEFLHVPLTTWDYVVAALVIFVAASLLLRRFVTDTPVHKRIRELLDDVSTWVALSAAVGGFLLVLGHSEMDALHARYENTLQGSIAQVRDSLSQMLAPRSLTAEQMTRIARELGRFSGQRVSIVITEGTAEIVAIGDQIVSALSKAGWATTEVTMGFTSPPRQGMLVEADSTLSDQQIAKVLVSVLGSCGLTVDGPILGSYENSPISLLIGEK